MSEARTIFTTAPAYAEVLEAVRQVEAKPTIIGPEDRWGRIVVERPAGVLQLTSLEWTGPGSELSRIILGLVNFLTRGPRRAPLDSNVVRLIAGSKFAVGIVANPCTSADDSFDRCIRAISAKLDASIFDGTKVTDARGVAL